MIIGIRKKATYRTKPAKPIALIKPCGKKKLATAGGRKVRHEVINLFFLELSRLNLSAR